MRKLILMTSAAMILPLNAFADTITCTATPNCRNLGYTEISCPNDNGVRCPWGNYWFCPPETTESETCKNTCAVGNILYSDMTCSVSLDISKTPIGVVVYTDGQGRGQATALKGLGDYKWCKYNTDVSTLTNLAKDAAKLDMNSFLNTQKIITFGNKTSFPAAWAAYEYSTLGTEAGEWSLPAAGILISYLENQTEIEKGLANSDGEYFYGTNYSTSTEYAGSIWTGLSSSTENDVTIYDIRLSDKPYEFWVRPVFEFIETSSGLCSISYQYTCTNANTIGGRGKSCGGKYKSCICNEGFAEENGICVKSAKLGKCSGFAKNCSIGDIIYSNGTCSPEIMTGKKPIAVVVYISENSCGQAMALKNLTNTAWANQYAETPELAYYTEMTKAATDFASCENTKKIISTGNATTFPAAWAAYEYSTEGTKAGDWCLPAAGIFTSIYNNLTKINNSFVNAGGNKFSSNLYSSTRYDKYRIWYSSPTGSLYGISHVNMTTNPIRPVIEF